MKRNEYWYLKKCALKWRKKMWQLTCANLHYESKQSDLRSTFKIRIMYRQVQLFLVIRNWIFQTSKNFTLHLFLKLNSVCSVTHMDLFTFSQNSATRLRVNNTWKYKSNSFLRLVWIQKTWSDYWTYSHSSFWILIMSKQNRFRILKTELLISKENP